MGEVKIDTHAKERSLDAKYLALDNPLGLRILLSDYHEMKGETMAFTDNYKTEFKNAATRIVRQDIEDNAEKNRIVKEVTDAYTEATGERPDHREMDELASWLIFGRKGVSTRKKMEIKSLEEAEKNGRN